MTAAEYWYERDSDDIAAALIWRGLMRYLWEVLLAAQEERIPEEKLRFIHAPHGSGYMELSLPCLNQTWLETDGQRGDVSIGVNTYYRFYDIFNDLCSKYI